MLLGTGKVPAYGSARQSKCPRVLVHALGRVRGSACQGTAANEIRLPLADGLSDLQRLSSVPVQETESGSPEQGSHSLEARRASASPADFRNRPSKRRGRSEEHTSELQSHVNLVCRLLLE